jgi:mannose-6-phosphate isomerase-like protein (cupin superfamily)
MDEYTVLEMRELKQLTGTAELEGAAVGAGASIILVDMPPGEGVRLHRHAYHEIFIVQQGCATYTVGEATLEVEAPRVLVVAPAVPHAFVNSGSGPLKQVDIHVSPRIVTEWL